MDKIPKDFTGIKDTYYAALTIISIPELLMDVQNSKSRKTKQLLVIYVTYMSVTHIITICLLPHLHLKYKYVTYI